MTVTEPPQKTGSQVMAEMEEVVEECRHTFLQDNRYFLSQGDITAGRRHKKLMIKLQGCWQQVKDQIARRRQVERKKQQKPHPGKSQVVEGTLTPPPSD